MENTIVKEVKPVAVIGLGPAGVTAGVLLKQWGFDPDIYEVGLAGGMVIKQLKSIITLDLWVVEWIWL